MRKKVFSWKLVQLLSFCCMLFLSDGAFAQNSVTLKGQVIDAGNNEPLIGVSIQEKGTTNGVITDIDGNFTMQATSGSTIVFSYIGYKTVELKASEVKGTIQMAEDSETLQEVVVVGYGIQKKVNLSGSVSAIEGDKIAAKPSANALAAMQGELPGVAVLRSSGQPGSETSGLRIRGYVSTNNVPALVLIDGIEGDMTLLNPNDIESVSVLKDAASASIYGARAAAGVVLITTKKGKTGKARVSYNGYFGINTPGNMPERLPAWEEQDWINENRFNATGKGEWSAEKSSWVGNPNFNTRPLSNGRWDFFEATNWVDEGLKKSTSQQSHSVSVSGGSEKTNYMLSANYYTKDGLLKFGSDSNDRYNITAKINTSINKYVDLGLNIQYQDNEIETPSHGATGLFNVLFSSRGRQPIFNPEGDDSGNIYNGDLAINPIDIMKNGGVKKTRYEAFTGRADLIIKDFVKGLRINLSASRKADYYMENTTRRALYWKDRFGGATRFSTNVPNSFYKGKNSAYKDLAEATATYNFSLQDAHNFTVLAGTSYERYRKDEMTGTARNMNSNDFFTFNSYDTSLATNTEIGDNIDTWKMMSYFGRINYNYKERYLVEANIRQDGSSRLAPHNRWATFPSFSAAWRLSEESWFNVDWIQQLKLRASWGQLGNGNILGYYDYMALLNSSQDGKPGTYLGETWYYQSQMELKDKTWEIVETTNVGIDWSLLNNRLTGTFEYYWKTNKDILVDVAVPHQIGIGVPKMNLGTLKVWGWDFNIGWQDKIKDFSYQVNINISDSDNELIAYGGGRNISPGIKDYVEGQPLHTIWGYKTDGYWKSKEEYIKYKEDHPGYVSFNDGAVSGGDVKYVAQGEPDHTIGAGGSTPEDPGDLVNLGSSDGRYLYGINLAAQWKGFDVSVMFQGVGKRTILMNNEAIAPFWQDHQMPWTIHRDYWTEDNQDAYWPRLYQYKGNDFNFKPSDKWLQDASYIRLKNVTIGYTLPVLKKYAERIRVYVTGEDLWEHSDILSVFDPEIGNNADRNIYPFFRTWTVGLNVTF